MCKTYFYLFQNIKVKIFKWIFCTIKVYAINVELVSIKFYQVIKKIPTLYITSKKHQIIVPFLIHYNLIQIIQFLYM